jgi:hypothetical protein
MATDRLRAWQLVAACAVAAVLTAGCGGSGTPAPTNPASGLTAPQRAALLEAQQWSMSLDPREQAAATQRYLTLRAGLAADCMRSRGFRYVPYTPAAPAGNTTAEALPARIGFGISTTIDQSAARGPGGAAAPVADPNAAVRGQLSAPDRTRYDRALPECLHQAQQKAGLPPGMVVLTGDTGAAIDEALHQANADPRVAAAATAWSACMTAAGFAAARRSDLLADLAKRATPFRAAYLAAQRAQPGRTVRLADILDPRQRHDLAVLQHDEIRAAAADQRCDTGLSKITSRVFQERFRALVEGHR